MAERDRERRDAALVMNEAVERCAFLLCFLDRVANDDEAPRHDLQMIGIAAELLHPALHVGVKTLPGSKIGLRGEDGLRGFGSKLAPGVRSARLNDDGPTLNRPSDVERPAH